MDQKKNPKKNSHLLGGELNSYKDTLRDASLLFEDKVLELSLLRRVGDILGYVFDLNSFYRMFVDILLEETNAENCSFLTMDTETNRLVLKTSGERAVDGTSYDHSGVTFSLGEGAVGKAASERKTILIDDVSEDEHFAIRATPFPIGSLLCTPLIFQEKVLGVVSLSHTQSHAFSQNDKRIIELLCIFVSSIIGNAIDYIKAKDQEKFKAMFEGVRLSILLIDPETNNIVDCNKYTEEWLGYSKQELISMEHGFDMLLSDYQEKAIQIVHAMTENDNSEFNEISFVKKDGSAYIAEISGTVISYWEKNVVQMTIRDITDRKKAEKEIEEARDYLENIFKTSADGILVSDSEGFITMVNDTIENMLGYSRDELVGKHSITLSPQGEFYEEIGNEFITKLMRDGVVTGYELFWLRKDERLVAIEVNAVLIKDKEGNRKGSVTSIRDITERKKMEKILKESEEKYHSLIEHANDAILSTNKEGIIISANKKTEEMFGYTREELVGESVTLLSPPIKRERQKKLFENLKTNNELYIIGKTMEGKGMRKDGLEFSFEGSVFSLELGEEFILTAILRDITNRKKKEEELVQIRTALENSSDAITMTNINMEIIYRNQAFSDLFGHTVDKINKEGVQYLYKDIVVINNVIKTIQSGKRWEGEVQILSKGGRELTCLLSASPILDDQSNIIGYLGIHTDITEQNKMRLQLLQSEKMKSLGELAGGVAHDFNNVLAAILGRAQLLKMIIDAPPKVRERRKSVIELKTGLEVIEQASLDGAETVRRIQEFARIRDDDKYFTSIDLNEIIDNALDFTRMKWKDDAETKGIKINIQKEFSPLPTTTGSAAELREVFINLINNAVDAMPQGGNIRIMTFKDDNNIIIKLEDTGVGMTDDRKNRIFDPFFTTKGVQSTGLGLSVSYGIINRHKGIITVDSVEDKGTTFIIKIPISKKTFEEEGVKSFAGKPKKARILVIEDEKEVRNILYDILTKGGHEVEITTDGIQGIEMFKKKEFDLVFTDLGMPGMSGWQVAEKIKGINGKVPVVLVTGWGIKQEESEMRDNCVDLIIHKPFEVKQVHNLVQEGMILRDRFKVV